MRVATLALPLVIAAGLLAGCASIGGTGAATTSTAEAWLQQSVAPDPAVAPLHWRHVIAEPRLQALVEQALRSAPDPSLAWQRLEAAEAATDPTGRAHWQAPYMPHLQALEGRAQERQLQTVAAGRAIQSTLIVAVADAWLALNGIDTRIAFNRQRIEENQAMSDLFNRRFEIGALSRLELRQIEARLGQPRTDADELLQARQVQAGRLAQLTGLPVEAIGPTSVTPEQPAIVLPPLDRLRSDVLLGRADILAAEQALAASHADVEAARALFFPSIALADATGAPSAELIAFIEGAGRPVVREPVLDAPLFSRGALRNTVAIDELRQSTEIGDYEAAIDAALSEAGDALRSNRQLQAESERRDAELAGQQDRVQLTRLRYEEGRSPYLEVLDAQRDLATARQRAVEARRAWLSARFRLHAVLAGGGTPYPAVSHAIEQGSNTP